MIREIALFSDALCPSIKLPVAIATLMRVALPFVARYLTYGNPFGMNWDGVIYTVLDTLATLAVAAANYIFVFTAFVEMYRKSIQINVAGMLIKPFKD